MKQNTATVGDLQSNSYNVCENANQDSFSGYNVQTVNNQYNTSVPAAESALESEFFTVEASAGLGSVVYSEFVMAGSETAFIAGYGNLTWSNFKSGYGGYYYQSDSILDAEKCTSTNKDDMMCWATAAANMLYYTKWCLPENNSEDEVFSIFADQFTLGKTYGGNAYYAIDWFLTGHYTPANWAQWDKPLTETGGYYSSSVKLSSYASQANVTVNNMTIARDKLQAGYAVGLLYGFYNSSGNRTGGHVVTVWGFTYDTTLSVTDPNYYTGIIISDSDDDKSRYADPLDAPNTIKILDITYDTTRSKYVLGSSIDSTPEILESFQFLAPNTGGITPDAPVASEGIKVYSSGTLVTKSGTVKDSVIQSSGNDIMFISSGAVASNTAIGSGGSVIVSSGGVANSTTVNYGGRMNISNGGVHCGNLTIANGATVSAYEGSIIDFTVSGRTASDGYLINNLSLIKGAPTYTITVSANQAGGSYKLAQGAENFTGTISVGDGMADYGTITVNGGAVKYNNIEYTLTQTNGNLLLNITDNRPPAVFIYSSGTLTSSGAEITGATLVSGGNNSMHVSCGGVANSTTVNSDGDMRIYSGGVANSTTVNSGGSMYISNGGVANSTTVNSGGSMGIARGGTATDITAQAGAGLGIIVASDTYIQGTYNGSAFVMKDSFISGYTVNISGYMFIFSGGVANSTAVNDSGHMGITKGGVANSTTVNTGWMYISSGGVANSTTVNNWGYMSIYKGGVANSTTVNSGGWLSISSGGVANSTTVNSCGFTHISSGGVANSTIINSWGYMYIHGGGMANSTTIYGYGSMHISSGGVANSTTVNSNGYMRISSGGVHRGNLTIANGATVSAYSGAKIDFTVADRTTADGYLINDLSLISGSPTYTITVSADQAFGEYKLAQGAENFTGTISVGDGTTNYGTLTVNGAALTCNNAQYTLTQTDGNLLLHVVEIPPTVFIYSSGTLTSSGTEITGATLVSGGNNSMHISSGGVANSTTVNDWGSMFISSGGVANSTTVNSFGLMYISSGGVANSTTINSRGSMYIASGGVANSTTVHSGAMRISSGGTANSTTVNYGGDMYISSGGTANSTTVNSSGYMRISSGGVANSTIVNSSGWMYISSGGTANNTTVNFSGYMRISSGGVANSTIVNSSGWMYISSGGVANSTTVNSYAYMSISSGGTALTIKENGGYVSVADGANVTFASNTITGMTLSYTSMTVHQNTVANSTTVNDWGSMFISSGGVANSTTVNSGGYMDIFIGGTANNTTVNSSGYMYISSGGVANSTTVNSGGYMRISSGGVAQDIIVSSDANLINSGIAGNVTLYGDAAINGGAITAQSGLVGHVGRVSGSTLGGSNRNLVLTQFCTLQSGASLENANVYALYVSSGATAKNITATQKLSVISGAEVANVVMENGYLDLYSFRNGSISDVTLKNSAYIWGLQSGNIYAVAGKEAHFEEIVVSNNRFGWNGTAEFVSLQGGNYVFSAGMILENGEISSNAFVQVTDGAAILNTVVSAGSIVGSEGGLLNNIEFTASNAYARLEGGTASFVKLTDGGYITVKGGTVSGVTVYDSSYLYASGGITDDVTVYSGGHIELSDQGTVNNAVVHSGGSVLLQGGSVSNAVIHSGGQLQFYTAGTVSDLTLSSGGWLGSFTFTQEKNFDKIEVSAGYATIAGGVVINGSCMNVLDQGVIEHTLLQNYNCMHISSGGTANHTVLSGSAGMEVSHEGIANFTEVNSGGYISVSAGGTANFTEVNYGAVVSVANGSADHTTVNAGGDLIVSSGGTVTYTVVNSTGYISIAYNGKAIDTELGSGAKMYLGGSAVNTVVNAGGHLILSGGRATDTVINNGSLTVSRGYLSNTTLNNGTVIFSGGTAVNTVIENGSAVINSTFGVTFSNTSLGVGAELYLSSYKMAAAKENGGKIELISNGSLGGVIENMILYGSPEIPGRSLYNCTIVSGGIALSDGSIASNTVVEQMGILTAGGSGRADNTVVNSGGSMRINNMYLTTELNASNVQINSGGSMIQERGNAEDIVIASGGEMYYSNGTATGITLEQGGKLTVSSAIITARGSNNGKIGQLGSVNGGTGGLMGTIENVVITSGNINLSSGSILSNSEIAASMSVRGKIDSCVITRGANVRCFNSGSLENSLVTSSGKAQITASASAENTTVQELGILLITASAFNTVVKSKGSFQIAGSGIAKNTVVSSGGLVIVRQNAVHKGTLEISSGASVTFSDQAILDFTVEGRTVDDDYLVNDLTLITGTPTYTITVAADQSFGTYKLARGANEFTGSISIGDGTTNYGDITVNGDIFKYNNVDYLLTQTDGDLELTIGDLTPPELTITGNASTWTNKDVVLTAQVSDGTVEYFNGIEWVEGDSLTVSKNGTYQFRATDEAGNVTEKEVVVDKIDKVAPTLEISGNATDWTNQDVTLITTVSDGVVEYFNGTEWVQGNTLTVSENGTYQFRATDEAGNVTEKEVVVDKIDKVAPTLEIAASITEATNQDVVLTAQVSDGVVEYYNGEKWVVGSTLTVSENGTYQFRATDEAGNVTTQSINVNNIDKVAPTLEIAASITEATNQDVVLTAQVSDGVVEYFNGTEWVQGSTLIVSENGTYQFRATDEAGNVTTQSININNIDKVAPSLEIAASITEATNQDVVLTAQVSDGVVEYYNGEKWVQGNSLTISANGTYQFRATDEVGNMTEKTIFIGNIDKENPGMPGDFTVDVTDSHATVGWNVCQDNGVAGIDGYYIRYGKTEQLEGDGELVETNSITLRNLELGSWYYQLAALDKAGNISDWSAVQQFEVTPYAPDNFYANEHKLVWDIVPGAASYTVEYSKDDFKTFAVFETTANSINVYYLPEGQYQCRVKVTGDTLYSSNTVWAFDYGVPPKKIVSNNDSNPDVFFATGYTVWESGYSAQHQGSMKGWGGTLERVSLAGKNKIADIFAGSWDDNVLLLSDTDNGDALFVDDIFTDLPDGVTAQARIAQIDEIRAGAGNDIIDMTSQRFDYVGDGVTVYGGSGDDTIWANKGSNKLYGDAGNDRIVGASGNDWIIGGSGNDRLHGGGGSDNFCFGGDWGVDTVEQLDGGSVTLWFDAEEDQVRCNGNVFTFGENKVEVIGENLTINLRFTGADISGVPEGAFAEAASEKIFEDKNFGSLA